MSSNGSPFKPVLVLGAGFSYNLFQDDPEDFPVYPLTNRFTKVLRRCLAGKSVLPSSIPPIKKEVIESLRRELDPFLYDENNFETILTLLSQEMPWDSESKANIRRTLYTEIRNFFSNYLTRYSLEQFKEYHGHSLREGRWDELRQLVQYLHRYEAKVISFNYDLLLEAMAGEVQFGYIENLQGFSHHPSLKNPTLDIFEKGVAALTIVEKFNNCSSKHRFKLQDRIGNTDWIEARINENNQIYVQIDEGKIRSYGKGKRDTHLSGEARFISESDEKIDFRFNAEQVGKRLEDKIITSQLMPDISCRSFYSEKGGALYDPVTQPKAKTFKILKLHGSANFLVQSALAPPLRYQTSYFIPVEDILKNEVDLDEIEKRYDPLIVPPVLNKQYEIPIIKEMWSHARQALAEATHVIFCGYSIPPTDYMSRALFSEVLQNKDGIEIKAFPPRKRKEDDKLTNDFGSISALLESEDQEPNRHSEYNCYQELNSYLKQFDQSS